MNAAVAAREPLCSRCAALCCRLTVVLQPGDVVEARFETTTAEGLRILARGADGGCLALDATRQRCTIYDTRPQACRRFAMAGPYCLAIRADRGRDQALGVSPPSR